MKQLAFFLLGFIFLGVLILFMKLGIRLVHLMINVWYVSIPLLGVLIYLLLSKKSKKRDARDDSHPELDPRKEIRLNDDPEMKDWNSNRNNHNGGKDK